MLEKKIQEIYPYFVGIYKTTKNEFAVGVEFPINWKVWAKKDDSGVDIINVTLSEQNINQKNKYIFTSRDMNHTNIIDFIISIKNQNIEIEEKRTLYKEKIEELAKIFDTNQLSKLRNITFNFTKKNNIKLLKVETKNIDE